MNVLLGGTGCSCNHGEEILDNIASGGYDVINLSETKDDGLNTLRAGQLRCYTCQKCGVLTFVLVGFRFDTKNGQGAKHSGSSQDLL